MHPNFGLQNSGEKFLFMICTDFLEFVVAKFNLNLALVQLLSVCTN